MIAELRTTVQGFPANRLGLAVILISLTLTGCNSAQPLTAPPIAELPVKVQTIRQSPVEDSSTFVGVLKSRQSVALQAQVAGQVCKIYVKNGDFVKTGTPLIELDPTKQQESVDGLAAVVETNKAEQTNAENTLKSLQATRASKLSALRYAKQQQQRYALLRSQGAVSQESVDQWENQTRVAQGDLDSVEAQIEAQRAEVGKVVKMISQSAHNVKEQQAQLKYFTVGAPFPGVVGDIPVRVGEYTTTSTVLTTLDQSKALEIYLSIPTIQAPRLRVGMPLQVVNPDGAAIGSGAVFFISPQVNNDNQSVMVKARLNNDENKFRSGEYVTTHLIWSKRMALTVPVTAVSRLSGQDFVFIAERAPGNKLVARQKPVNLGEIVGDSFRVISGLSAGESIVTSGVQNLSDGSAIVAQPST